MHHRHVSTTLIDVSDTYERSANHSWAYTRRYAGMIVVALLFVLVYYYSVHTARGQFIDSVAMASLITWTHRFHNATTVILNAVTLPVMIAVMIISGLIAIIRHRAALALRVVMMIAGAALTSYVLKFYILSRPDLGVTHGVPNSFPSGHVTAAACAAFAFIMVVPHRARPWAALFGAAITSLMGIVVISHSWHRLSDVIGAILVVTFWALLTHPIERSRCPSRGVHAFIYTMTGVLLLATIGLDVAAWNDLKNSAIWPLTTSPSAPFDALTTAGQALPALPGIAAMTTIVATAMIACYYVERQVHP